MGQELVMASEGDDSLLVDSAADGAGVGEGVRG